MSPQSVGRVRLVLRRLGAGWTLWPLLILLPLTSLQAASDLAAFSTPVPGRVLRIVDGKAGAFVLGLVFWALIITWACIAVRHVKVAVDTWQLRVPGFPRILLLSVCGVAAWNVLSICTLLLLWREKTLDWVQLIAWTMVMGFLIALTASPRKLLTLWLLIAVLALAGVDWAAPVARAADAHPAIAAGAPLLLSLLLIVWRVWSFVRALRHGSYPGFLRRGFYADRADLLWRARPFSGHVTSHTHAAADAMRIILGPLFQPHRVWCILCLGALPAVLLTSWVRVIPGVPQMPTVSWHQDALPAVTVLTTVLGALWFKVRAQRLATLLYEQRGETVELALLPGLGEVWQRRRALLKQALIPPLLQGGLCLALIVASCWALLYITHAPQVSILNVAVPAAMVLLLFASLSLGVTSGRFASANGWLKGWVWLWVLAPAACSPVDGRGVTLGGPGASPLTVWAAWWAAVLAGMAYYGIANAVRLRREHGVLCQ